MATYMVNLAAGKDGFTRFIADLSKVDKALQDASFETDLNIRQTMIRSAKQRAPRWSGFLRQSIHAGKIFTTTNGYVMEVLVDAPYAAAQELGFAGHLVPFWKTTGSPFPGFQFVSDYMGPNSNASGILVRKNTPFMRPALLSAQKIYGSLSRREFNKKLKKVFRGSR